MITRYETIITLISVAIGMIATLIGVIWKARGWVDKLAETDKAQGVALEHLATAVDTLSRTMAAQHSENVARFVRLERRGRIHRE